MKYLFTIMLFACTLNASAQLQIAPGTRMVNQGYLVMENSGLHNNGMFNNLNAAVVVLRGSQNWAVTGSGTTQFYALEIAKPSGEVMLQKNISASGPIKFTKGSVNLGNHNIQLVYPGGLLQQESEQNRIYTVGTGEIYIQQLLNAPGQVNPGNLGAMITSSQNLGLTTVKRGHALQANAAQQQSIRRHFSIEAVNNNNLNANLHLQYFDAELNSNLESGLLLYKKESTAGWMRIGKDAADAGANYVQISGLASLHAYTLFSDANALPLQLVAFTVICKDGLAQVQWITANEVNTKQFIIEKSTDGASWQAASVVTAKGNTQQHTYTSSVAASGNTMFRLKMEDADGKFTYSAVRNLDCNNQDMITVGPNPTTGPLNITFQQQQKNIFVIEVYDSRGVLLISKRVQTAAGLSTERFSLQQYAAGTYLVKITGTDGKGQVYRIIRK